MVRENRSYAFSRHARIDPDPVLPHQTDAAKSIGRSITLPQNLTHADEAEPILLSLADSVGRTARKNNREWPNRPGRD